MKSIYILALLWTSMTMFAPDDRVIGNQENFWRQKQNPPHNPTPQQQHIQGQQYNQPSHEASHWGRKRSY